MNSLDDTVFTSYGISRVTVKRMNLPDMALPFYSRMNLQHSRYHLGNLSLISYDFREAPFSKLIGILTQHLIVGTHVKRMGRGYLVKDFCRSCMDEVEEETVLHLLDAWTQLLMRGKEAGTYYLKDLNKLSGTDMGSPNPFIGLTGGGRECIGVHSLSYLSTYHRLSSVEVSVVFWNLGYPLQHLWFS